MPTLAKLVQHTWFLEVAFVHGMYVFVCVFLCVCACVLCVCTRVYTHFSLPSKDHMAFQKGTARVGPHITRAQVIVTK